MCARPLFLVALVGASACSPDRPLLIVDVRSDAQPAVEADRVEVVVFRPEDAERPGAMTVLTDTRALLRDDDLVGGVRAFEGELGETGEWVAEARLMRGAALVAERRALVTVRQSLVVTLVLTSACSGVECGVDPTGVLLTCRAGGCVDARCSPEQPEHCPAAECETGGECPSTGSDCVRPTCFSGECGSVPDDSRCPAGTCDRALGCVPAGDAGVVDDAGVDAGLAPSNDLCAAPIALSAGMVITGTTCAATDTAAICGASGDPEVFFTLPQRCTLRIDSEIKIAGATGDPCGPITGPCTSAGGTISGSYGPPSEDFIALEKRSGCGPYELEVVSCP